MIRCYSIHSDSIIVGGLGGRSGHYFGSWILGHTLYVGTLNFSDDACIYRYHTVPTYGSLPALYPSIKPLCRRDRPKRRRYWQSGWLVGFVMLSCKKPNNKFRSEAQGEFCERRERTPGIRRVVYTRKEMAGRQALLAVNRKSQSRRGVSSFSIPQILTEDVNERK